jgi:putative radical SAM enzyme (TIGR03279 family)
MGGIVASNERGGIAEALGLMPGDEIVAINGHELRDSIDYRFFVSDDFISLAVRRGGQLTQFEIEKDPDTLLGVQFTDELFDGVRTCGARCIFCFVEQLPKGLRKSLYLKDDDYRLSFLHGNYVTLANVSQEELDRVVEQRLSPLYISVHAVDDVLRQRMLGRKAPGILWQIDYLAAARITMHTQIVLCPGINDGGYLSGSIRELSNRYPSVQSIAVVPVGLTAHRRGKTAIPQIHREYAQSILDLVACEQKRLLAEYGSRIVWAADEFYLKAGKPVPNSSTYEGYPQLGNGVGMVRRFLDSGRRSKTILDDSFKGKLHATLVSGTLFAPILAKWALSIERDGPEIDVLPVTNNLFGDSVTVTGLLAGRDVIDQLKGRRLGDVVFVPDVALRDGVFLDEVTLDDVESALGRKVEAIAPNPVRLARRMIELAGGCA